MIRIVETNATPHRRDALAEAVLRIGMTRGLDRVSVREVAHEADCSIGTVQHYFRTKDEMLVFAFRRVVARTMERALAVDQSKGVRHALADILAQLLPLDEERRAETTVHLAFATRAAVEPALAEVQSETLESVRSQLTELLLAAGRDAGRRADRRRARRDAVRLLALVDGLALHAVSAPGQLTPADLRAALEQTLSSVLD
jgi:AcrR family transcriptional regulator